MRIIQALLDKPQYLIFDEPFDALDKKSRQITREMLEDYLNEDKERTLVFTGHNDEMELFATQILEIEDRNLVEVNSAKI